MLEVRLERTHSIQILLTTRSEGEEWGSFWQGCLRAFHGAPRTCRSLCWASMQRVRTIKLMQFYHTFKILTLMRYILCLPCMQTVHPLSATGSLHGKLPKIVVPHQWVLGEFPCRPPHWILDNSGSEVFACSSPPAAIRDPTAF